MLFEFTKKKKRPVLEEPPLQAQTCLSRSILQDLVWGRIGCPFPGLKARGKDNRLLKSETTCPWEPALVSSTHVVAHNHP